MIVGPADQTVVGPADQTVAGPSDPALVAASDSMRAALRDLIATGPEAAEEEDREAWARFNAAEDIILATPATTLGGALAKLRRAITYEVNYDWVEKSIAEGDVATLAARAEELSGSERLLVDALCTLERLGAST